MSYKLTNYSKSPNNIYGFTDEQISNLYELVENIGVGHLVFHPRSTEDFLNPNFLRDEVVNISNKYYETYLKKPVFTDSKTAKKKELHRQFLIAKGALDQIALIMNDYN